MEFCTSNVFGQNRSTPYINIEKMNELLGACRGCMSCLSPQERRVEARLTEKFLYCTNIKDPELKNLPNHFCPTCEGTIKLCYRFIREARRVDLAMRSLLNPVKVDSDTFTSTSQESKVPFVKVEDYDIKEECRAYEDFEIKTDCVDDKLAENMQLQVEVSMQDATFSDDDADDYHFSNVKNEEKEKSAEKTSEYEQHVKNILAKAPKRKRKLIDDGSHECQYCHKSFSTRIWYKKHLSTVHADNTDSNFVCKICSKGFSRGDILKQHMVTHSDERPFACHLCPKRFKMRKQLNLHLRMHEEQAEYMCHVCNASFQWKAVLTTHMKIHFDEKSNLCHLCGTGFTLAGNLAVHMRTHTGEKPYACSRCNFRCSMQSSLRRHERIHTGVRPYPCTTCDKRFADTGTLTRHIRTHTGELPYRCKFCSRAFIDSGKRKRHMLSQHQVASSDVPVGLIDTAVSLTHPPKTVDTLIKPVK